MEQGLERWCRRKPATGWEGGRVTSNPFLDCRLAAAKHIPSHNKVGSSCKCCRHRLANTITWLGHSKCMLACMHSCMYVRSCMRVQMQNQIAHFNYIYISNIIVYIYIICIITYHNVWIRVMEQRYGTDPSNRYGKGVWNGCGPGPCSGPYKLIIWLAPSCTHMHSKILKQYETIAIRFPLISCLDLIKINFLAYQCLSYI